MLFDDAQDRQRAGAIAAYRGALPPGELTTFAITPLDRTGVAVWVAPFITADGFQEVGIGYGATDNEALCGAMGELTESVRCHVTTQKIQHRESISHRQMTSKWGEDGVVDPVTLCLPAGSYYDADRPIDWVPATRLRDGQSVWVPLEFVTTETSELRGCPPLIPPITNGLGAGPTRSHAVAHAVCELLQRDGNCTAFRALDRGVAIELDGEIDPGLAATLTMADSAGIDLIIKLARVEFGLINVYVVARDRRGADFSLQLTACGEAVDPDAQRAIRKAVLECLAARCRKAFMHGPLDPIEAIAPPGYLDAYRRRLDLADEEPRSLRSMTDWVSRSPAELESFLADSVFAVRRRVPLSSLPTTPVDPSLDGADVRLSVLTERLADAGMDILVVDFSGDAAQRGVHAVRAIIPGLECETMSYHRIGARGVARAIQAGDRYAGMGQATGGRLAVRMTAADQQKLGGPAWLDPAEVDRIVGPLYPLYREPSTHAVQLNKVTAEPA